MGRRVGLVLSTHQQSAKGVRFTLFDNQRAEYLTRSAMVIKNILDPTEGRENTSSVALEITSVLSERPYFSDILVAASNGARGALMLSTTRS